MNARLPARYRQAFVCPRCDAFSAQHWDALYTEVTSDGSSQPWYRKLDTEVGVPVTKNVFDQVTADPWGRHSDVEGWITTEHWATSRCAACGLAALWHEEEVVYPRSSTIPAPSVDMPAAAHELYLEASAVAAVSRRAGAALARATLERVLKELDPHEGQDHARLDERILLVEPRVSSELAAALTVVRHVGNKALHDLDSTDGALILVLDDADATHLEALFSIVNDLVDQLVTKPAALRPLLDSVPENVRRAVEEKRAAMMGRRGTDASAGR